jgi:hypothetical protein
MKVVEEHGFLNTIEESTEHRMRIKYAFIAGSKSNCLHHKTVNYYVQD